MLRHMFEQYTTTSEEIKALPDTCDPNAVLKYVIEVHVNDFIGLCVSWCNVDLNHVSGSINHVIRDVFLPDDIDENDPNS